MENVIKLADRLPKLVDGEDDLARDKFLIDEGLDLLAAFRSIADSEARRALFRVIQAVAESPARAHQTLVG